MYKSMHIALTGLEAARLRLEAGSSNLANLESSASRPQDVYRPRRVILREETTSFRDVLFPGSGKGVQGTITELSTPAEARWDPYHPDADSQGMVYYPHIDLPREIAEMVAARRSYQLSLTVYAQAKQMFLSALELGRS